MAKLPCGVGGAPAFVPAHAAPSVQAGDLAEVWKAKRGLLSSETETLPLAKGRRGRPGSWIWASTSPTVLKEQAQHWAGVSTCSLEAAWGPCSAPPYSPSSARDWSHGLKTMSPPLGSEAAASLGNPCPVGQPPRHCWHSRTPRSGAGASAAACSRVSTIPSLLHRPLPTWQGFYSQPRRELGGDGRGRRRERAASHILRACLLASPGPASSSSGRSVEWDKRTWSSSSAQAQKKHPQMKLKSRLSWPHQMLGATPSVSQCERLRQGMGFPDRSS